MGDFEDELKQGFLEEATQLLRDTEQCFLVLEANPGDRATLEKIFRLAHNIKGSSRAVGFDALGAFTHEFESFLIRCKSGEIPIDARCISLLLTCNDHVNQIVEALKAEPSVVLDSNATIAQLRAYRVEDAGATSAAVPPPAPEPPEIAAAAPPAPPPAAVVSSAATAEPAMSPAAAIATGPATAATAPAAETAPAAAAAGVAHAAAPEDSIRVSIGRLEKLVNFVGEMVILQTVLKEQSYGANPDLLRRTVEQMGKVTKEVQQLSMSLRMVPLRQTFQKMQRIVRDTSGVLHKRVQLVLDGEDTEVDKLVLEALADPLVHLVRNGVDHGIEAPAERLAAGKPEAGTLTLQAYHRGGRLVIEVRDDGGGIPAERLRQKALEKGILKPGQSISDDEAVRLIFHPGFSIKSQVTEVSGRGVGMDVVKSNIERMQGEVRVETALGRGSTFKIILPLTLAIIDAMVVRCGEERFILPLTHVHESVKTRAADLQRSAGAGEVLMLRGENLPVVRLHQALGRRARTLADAQHIAIIVRSQGNPFAALVDDIVGQHQVVVKKLGSELQHLPGFSGSAILGDGRPALILELASLAAASRPEEHAAARPRGIA